MLWISYWMGFLSQNLKYVINNRQLINQDMLKDDPNQGLISRNQAPLISQVIRNKEPAASKKQQPKQSKKHPQKKEKRAQITYILKTLNFIVGIAYIAFAVYCYQYGYQQTDLQTKGPFIKYVLPAYVGLSGLIILLIECRVGFLVRNLRFFYNYFGRGFFNVYAGLMPLMLITDWSNLTTFEIITIVASSLMCVIGLLYMGLKCFCCEKQGESADEQQKKRKKRLYEDAENNDQ